MGGSQDGGVEGRRELAAAYHDEVIRTPGVEAVDVDGELRAGELPAKGAVAVAGALDAGLPDKERVGPVGGIGVDKNLADRLCRSGQGPPGQRKRHGDGPGRRLAENSGVADAVWCGWTTRRTGRASRWPSAVRTKRRS